MSASTLICFFAIIAVSILPIYGQFDVPDVTIEVINPRGLKASIPALPGIQAFHFHAKLNAAIQDKETGSIYGEGRKQDNKFVFEDPRAIIESRDTIYYWVFVQYNNMGYKKHSMQTVTNNNKPIDSVVLPNPNTCNKNSQTRLKGEQVCSGALIFEENFDAINTDRWIIEKKISSDEQENEFASFQPSAVRTFNGLLEIKPTLLLNQPNFDEDSLYAGELDLNPGCTSLDSKYCKHTARFYDILPPVISGKISSKDNFQFKYGKIEITAKFPMGDWIYPELYLEPVKQKYGISGYESGVMRIAFARGNLHLNKDSIAYGNNVLSGGPLLDQFTPCRNISIVTNQDTMKYWGKVFHKYALTWTPEMIELEVDGEKYGTVKPRGGFKTLIDSVPVCGRSPKLDDGTPLAPFDEEFYISVGLEVGGISDFPDGVGGKAWKNKSPKSKHQFWEFHDNWYSTWNEDSKLLVDSIKVWAL